MKKPGKAEFMDKETAMEFAKARVEECWIVHCYAYSYPYVPNKWIVNWWCI